MNNEPVAWMLLRNESCVELTEWYGVMRGWEEFLGDNEKIVELYTHPAKTLTDEKIEEVYRTVEQDFALTESKKSDGGWRNFPVELGRAILRKAQEK